MDLSHFLASFLGLYYLIFGVILLFRKETVLRSVEDFYSSRSFLLLGGIMALFLGIAIVLTHSIWIFNWQGLVSLIGYLAIFKGIMMLGFADEFKKTSRHFLSTNIFYIWLGFIFFLGAYLFYSGFIA